MRLVRERGSNLTEIIPYLMMFTSSNQQKKPQIFKEGRVTLSHTWHIIMLAVGIL